MASSSGSSASVVVSSTSSSRANSEADTCAYYGLEPGETCFTRRSCFDCLNVPVANNPEGCVLSQFGYCESMVFYDASVDYRVTAGPNADSGSPHNFSGGLYHQFPAVNTTYCEATDPACLECNVIAVNYSMQNNFLARTTKFCLGESACVCVLSCDPTVWKLRTVSLCDESEAASTSDSASSTSWTAYTTSPSIIVNRTSSSWRYLYWLLGVPAFIVLVVAHYCIRLKYLEIRRRRLLRIPRRSPRSRLRLSAWRALNEQLIDKEKEPVASVVCRIEPISVQEERAT
ncbi:Maltose acetyltransferase [Phytophthora pseudosyringae]|uniref:Maltose acetyltransferase n=1 Tax=Phytophthora pseudosyringae TaxID=221518 RepID=A0A8T1VFL2_9STRA|nr:Maltose acetyltransferase [Phytophthora pseudosyringae]